MMSTTYLVTIVSMMAVAVAPDALPDDRSIVERDGIRIEASITAQLYVWKVTNDTEQPITHFEISQYNTYDHAIPVGWEMHYEDDQFAAWATTPLSAIQPGQTRKFSARGGSVGSVLGLKPARLTMGDGDDVRIVEIASVWAPSAKPFSMVILVITCLTTLALLQFLLVRRRQLRESSATL